jgi:hypothetical protein
MVQHRFGHSDGTLVMRDHPARERYVRVLVHHPFVHRGHGLHHLLHIFADMLGHRVHIHVAHAHHRAHPAFGRTTGHLTHSGLAHGCAIGRRTLFGELEGVALLRERNVRERDDGDSGRKN